MRLKSIANWNQVELDWDLLLSVEEGGNFVAIYRGKEIGTTTTFIYQNRFSWIGMVLVDPAYRGLGIGKMLLKKAVAFAQTKGTVRLDATPQGKKLYETMGFVAEREMVRVERKANNGYIDSNTVSKPILPGIVNQLIEYDSLVFGANRAIVIRDLFHRNQQYAFFIKRKGKISGYCLGRSGSNFEQIGPILAETAEDARDLLQSSLAYCGSKPVIVDTFTENKGWLNILYSLGFYTQRPFTRMYLGELIYPGIPDFQYAIAGPELG
jgi:ribosomal protein S18 acetylase RimI-like enzyme